MPVQLIPQPKWGVTFERCTLDLDAKDHIEKAVLSACEKLTPTQPQWRVIFCRRIKEAMDTYCTSDTDDYTWHAAIGTRYALNTTSDDASLCHLKIGRYFHVTIWRTKKL